MERKLIISLIFAAVAVTAVIAVLIIGLQITAPPQLTEVVVRQTSPESGILQVSFNIDKPMTSEVDKDRVYLLVNNSSNELHIENVPILGPLMPNVKGRKTGYFVVVDPTNEAPPGSLVTVVIGDFRKEGVPVLTYPTT
jgi:hypothetical protein